MVQRRSLGDQIGLEIPVELVGSLITKFTSLTVSDSAAIYMGSVLEALTERVLTLACACAGAYADGIAAASSLSEPTSECVTPRHVFSPW